MQKKARTPFWDVFLLSDFSGGQPPLAVSEWALLPELVSYQTKQDFQSPSYRKLEKEKKPKHQEICKPQPFSSIIPHHGYYQVSPKVAHKS